MTNLEPIIHYILKNNLIPDIILAIFYLITFLLSLSRVYLKSYRILRKKEPPVLYSAKFNVSCINLFNKFVLMFCIIYVWSILAYFVRQLVLKNSKCLKNKYCIFENIFSLFLITLGAMVIGSTSTFRLDFGIYNYTEQFITNALVILVILGLLLLSLICRLLYSNLNTNFCNEINLLTKNNFNIKKNNFHVLRIMTRNIEAIQIYIITGLIIILSIYLPSIFYSSRLLLCSFYIIIGITDWLLVMQMSKVCVPAITQTKLEE